MTLSLKLIVLGKMPLEKAGMPLLQRDAEFYTS
jgi:hypothetical protein